MKNILAALLIGCTASAFALEIERPLTVNRTVAEHPYKVRQAKRQVTLTPATYTIITNTPDGESLKDLSWESDACAPSGTGTVTWVHVAGYAPQVVVNGNKMYLYAPLTQLSEIGAAWIEGNISADGKKVTFPTPQPYLLNGFDVLYATRCNPDGSPDPNNLDLVFSYEDGNLVQEDGGVLLLTNLEGGFYGYGEKDIVITKINDPLVILPDGLTPQSYILKYTKAGNENRQTALIAFDGDDVYFSDPLGIENTWFKGVRNGNTITVSTPQYMGSEVGFPMYVTTGTEFHSTQMDPVTGQPYDVTDYKVNPGADITFTIDDASGVISSNQLLLMNSGKNERGNAYSAVMKPVYTPWEPVSAVPADPSVSYYVDLNDYAEYGLKGCMLSFDVPSTGTNGEFIPQENLYYQICFDGEPLEFYGTTYIPYYGQFVNSETMESIQLSSENYDTHSLQVPYNPKESVSIQSFYDFAGDLIPSKTVEYGISGGELVDAGVGSAVADKETVAVKYFDLNGVAIEPAAASGIVVRQKVYSDGTTKTEKVICR